MSSFKLVLVFVFNILFEKKYEKIKFELIQLYIYLVTVYYLIITLLLSRSKHHLKHLQNK